MSLLSLVLAVGGPTPDATVPGTYRAVTETEYAIELVLEPDGRAELELRMWVAGEPSPTDAARLHGAWSRIGQQVAVRLSSGAVVTYRLEPCLTYADFGASGCSAGLSFVETTLPVRYDLHRYGLWRADALGVQP